MAQESDACVWLYISNVLNIANKWSLKTISPQMCGSSTADFVDKSAEVVNFYSSTFFWLWSFGLISMFSADTFFEDIVPSLYTQGKNSDPGETYFCTN